PRGIFPLLHNAMKHAYSGVQRAGAAVRTVTARMVGGHKWKEEMEMRLRAFGVQLEDTRRELEEAEMQRVEDMRELSGLREELAVLTRKLGGQKDFVKSQLDEAEKRQAEGLSNLREKCDMAERRGELDMSELREEARNLHDEMRAELAREREERRREVQELNWPHAMDELAACKEWQMTQDLKMNIEVEIKRSEGDRKKALE
ncbi:unnamed protein product, partial [Closterium sp. Naga37s-1]